MNQTKVFKLLKADQEEPSRGCRHIRFLGIRVCNKGFMKLVGIGKHRFCTLSTSARRGDQHCPYDGRYIITGQKPASTKREKVHHWLMQMYLTAGEPIPDGLNSNKRPRHGKQKFDSPSLNRSEMRHLPYGSITEYLNQCRTANPGLHISRKLFCTDTWILCYGFVFELGIKQTPQLPSMF